MNRQSLFQNRRKLDRGEKARRNEQGLIYDGYFKSAGLTVTLAVVPRKRVTGLLQLLGKAKGHCRVFIKDDPAAVIADRAKALGHRPASETMDEAIFLKRGSSRAISAS